MALASFYANLLLNHFWASVHEHFLTSHVLGGPFRRSYFENEPVVDSNQHLLLASLECYPFRPTGLKLSKLCISYNPFTRSFLFLEAPFL